MANTLVVAQSPNKRNVCYEERTKSSTLEETFAPLVEELRLKRTSMDRVIMFGQTYED